MVNWFSIARPTILSIRLSVMGRKYGRKDGRNTKNSRIKKIAEWQNGRMANAYVKEYVLD